MISLFASPLISFDFIPIIISLLIISETSLENLICNLYVDSLFEYSLVKID